ncbi:MAG: hypothetical protein ABFR65_00935 [Pseudomonadota bacterium]
MKDYFHEARTALKTAEIEFREVSSLSSMGSYATNQACENAVRGIWKKATGNEFPHEQFKPFHKPAIYLKQMGLFSYYSSDAQQFLEKQVGYALDEVRYESTQAFRDHTKPKNIERGKTLIAGTLLIIDETEKLSDNQVVIELIRSHENKI